MQILKRIRDFALIESKIDVGQLFKIMDDDFDGSISLMDLRNFIVNILEEKEVQETRLERVHKLLDQNKSGSVQLSDIRSLLEYSNYEQ
jgi:Ca2+-binding EF-hand superfamily protein